MTRHRALPTWIEFAAEDPLTGYVIADDLVQLYRDEDLSQPAGALGRRTMTQLDEGLKVALAVT